MSMLSSGKWSYYWRLMRFDKPIGTLLLLWPTVWALWMAARGMPNLAILLVFLLGVILMRAAGCVINDFSDRHLDAHVARTRARPLAANQVAAKEALLLFVVLVLMAFLLVLTLNALTIKLAIIGFLLASIYPFMKRMTHLPQLVLGLAFSWGIPMAFAAITGNVPMIAWILLVANVLWTVAYDTQYAMVDRVDDLKVGIKSTAILFGRFDRLIIGILQALVLLLLIWVGYLQHFAVIYYGVIMLSALFFLYQQKLIAERLPAQCFKAFLNNHWVGLLIFAALLFAL